MDRKVNFFQSERDRQKKSLFENFPPDGDLKVTLGQFFEHAHQREYSGSKQRQKLKLEKLLNKCKTSKDTIDLSGTQLKKWVVNTSKRVLTEVETKVLAKGLNYSVAPDKIPVHDYIVETEKACKRIPEEERQQLRAEIRGALKSKKKSTSPRRRDRPSKAWPRIRPSLSSRQIKVGQLCCWTVKNMIGKLRRCWEMLRLTLNSLLTPLISIERN